MANNLPPKIVDINKGNSNDDLSVEYLEVLRRSKGIIFNFNGSRFLYEYNKDFDYYDGGTLKCIDIHKNEDIEKPEDRIYDDQITFVDIIETEYGYVTSANWILVGQDVEYLINQVFDDVALRMFQENSDNITFYHDFENE